MSTLTLVNSGSIFNNANGTVTLTLPTSPSINMVVLSGGAGGGSSQLKQLLDVVGANTAANGYVLQYDTHGTANTADDTFDVVPNNLDGGGF
jgi:hypothetical protein